MIQDWRTSKTVLVCDAQTIGSIAVIRSLGRAGYNVVAMASDQSALGLSSRYVTRSLVHPPYADPAFDSWLDVLLERRIDLIIPSEGFLLRVRPRFADLQPMLPVPASPDDTYLAFSKFDVRERFIAAGLTDNLSPALLIGENDALPTVEEIAALSQPLFIKVDSVHARRPGQGSVVKRCEGPAAAREEIRRLLENYKSVLVEGFVPGVGVGAFLTSWNGRPLAQFMHRRLHEVPHTGGYSSYRRSWHHGGVLADAKLRAQALGWDGVSMFEYRWDPTSDRFWLMEINARFWGSLHLALFAGVDFPTLLADAFFGQPAAAVERWQDVRCRLTFPAEVEHVLSCLKDEALPWSRRLLPVAEFCRLQVSPGIYSDLSFPGDRALYWKMMIQTLSRLGSIAIAKSKSKGSH